MRCDGRGTPFPPVAAHGRERSTPVPDVGRFDVGVDRLEDVRAIQREQGDERVLGGVTTSRGHEGRTDLVAVEADGVRLVAEAWPPRMGRR